MVRMQLQVACDQEFCKAPCRIRNADRSSDRQGTGWGLLQTGNSGFLRGRPVGVELVTAVRRLAFSVRQIIDRHAMKVLICAPPALAAIISFTIIVFNVNYRGHYVFCAPTSNCLSIDSILRFSVPFLFNLVRLSVAFYVVLFVGYLVARLLRNARGRGK